MLNVADGYVSIKAGGRLYEAAPSFFNIAKIGEPEEIIKTFHDVGGYNVSHVDRFSACLKVLNACGIDDPKLTGGLVFSEAKKKTMILVGLMSIDDVGILAAHLMQHGICGSARQVDYAKEQSNTKALTEFNPYDYVIRGVESLSLAYSEAWQLTMTQYVNLMRSKIKSMEDRGEIKKEHTHADVQALLKQREEILSRQKSKD
tara:strand:- start:3237 stop:3845 length:609 start_codon:yes stop_codon:yes gene_type:complete